MEILARSVRCPQTGGLEHRIKRDRNLDKEKQEALRLQKYLLHLHHNLYKVEITPSPKQTTPHTQAFNLE